MLAYRCSSTGLLYPADYIEMWGRKYGIGLGPVPVSEAWESNYEMPVSQAPRDIQNGNQIGHSIRACGAPVFPVEVSESEYEAGKAVLQSEDPNGRKRWDIVRKIQDTNHRSRRALALTRIVQEG